MELVRGGTLRKYVQDRFSSKNPITDEEAATIMKGIFSALNHMHSKGIVHRDLKLGNSYENALI
jgi:calcium-dependent protein kinase